MNRSDYQVPARRFPEDRRRRLVREIVEVGSELGVMTAESPGEIVGELVALLCALDVGIRLSPEIGNTGDVDGWISASRNGRVVEVRQSTPRILKAEVVHLVAAEGPGVLCGPGHVTKSLCRGT